MHASKGGVVLGTILEMDMEDFGEWIDAAEDFHKRLNPKP